MKNKQFSVNSVRKRVLICALTVLVTTICTIFSSTLLAVESAGTVFLVRHAEKTAGGDDPGLSAAGIQRVRELVALLADARIRHIHSSDYKRTRDTASPLAESLGIKVQLYDPLRPGDLVARLKSTGGRHLVVGHSNTVPELVERLGGNGETAIDEAGEYDRLYIVTLAADGSTSTLLLRYGERFSP